MYKECEVLDAEDASSKLDDLLLLVFEKSPNHLRVRRGELTLLFVCLKENDKRKILRNN